MTTILHKPAASRPLCLRFTHDGQVVEYEAVRLSIPLRNACVLVPGIADGDAWSFDLRGYDLPPRLYPMTIQFREDGSPDWIDVAIINVNIQGGC